MLVPNRKQWKSWSLPNKLTTIGAFTGVLGLILTILFFTIQTFWKSSDFIEENLIPADTKEVLNEVLSWADSIPNKKQSPLSDTNRLLFDVQEKIHTNPYNINALISRGQIYYTDALFYGKKGYREAILDFKKAASLDENLSDPHYGLGTVYYQLAIFDLVKRKLYKIYNKGGYRINKTTNLPEMRSPVYSLMPDDRNYLILKAALNEFQTGRNLQSYYDANSKYSIVLFSSKDIENRIKTIRSMLQYDPPGGDDEELLKLFTFSLINIQDFDIDSLFESIPQKDIK